MYLLINARHGVTEFDKNMLEHMNDKLRNSPEIRERLTLQPILTKVDAVPQKDAAVSISTIRRDIAEYAPLCMPALLTALAPKISIGVDAVRESIIGACLKK